MYGLLALSTALALFYNGVVRAASVRDSGQKTMRFNVVVAAAVSYTHLDVYKRQP